MAAKDEPQKIIGDLAATDFKTHWLKRDLTTELKGTASDKGSSPTMGDELAQAADRLAALVIDHPFILSEGACIRDLFKIVAVVERTAGTLRDRKVKERIHSAIRQLKVFVLENAHDEGLTQGVGDFLRRLQPEARRELLRDTYQDDLTAVSRHLGSGDSSLRHWCLLSILEEPFTVVTDRGFFPSQGLVEQLTVQDSFELLHEVRRLEREVEYVHLDGLSLPLDEMQNLVEILSGVRPQFRLVYLTRQFVKVRALADDFPHLTVDSRFHFPLLRLTRHASERQGQTAENLENLAQLRENLLDQLVDPFVLESMEALSSLMTEREIQKALSIRYRESLAFLNVDVSSDRIAPYAVDYCRGQGWIQRNGDQVFLSSDLLEVLKPQQVKQLLARASASEQ